MHSKLLFSIFFCSIFSQSAIFGSTINDGKSTSYDLTESFTRPLKNLEQSMFDLEDKDGCIDRTPINRFELYDLNKTPSVRLSPNDSQNNTSTPIVHSNITPTNTSNELATIIYNRRASRQSKPDSASQK